MLGVIETQSARNTFDGERSLEQNVAAKGIDRKYLAECPGHPKVFFHQSRRQVHAVAGCQK